MPAPKSKTEVARPPPVRPEAPSPPPVPIRASTSEDPLIAAVKAGTAEGGGGVAPVPLDPPPTGFAAQVTLQNRTGSWANISLDGEVFEFRGERERALEVGSGVHHVQVREFRDQKVWWTGELWVWPEDALTLQFSQAAPPAVPGRPDAWHAPELDQGSP